MGSSNSVPEPEALMDHQPYPDMNIIFKGIPKMIQIADDMHRMTDYIMDLRNMTIGLVCLSLISLAVFLIIKLAKSRSRAMRGIEFMDDRTLQRHGHSQYSTYQGYPEPSWQEHRPKNPSTVIEMEKVHLNDSNQQYEASDNHRHHARADESKNLPNGHSQKLSSSLEDEVFELETIVQPKVKTSSNQYHSHPMYNF